jgi:molecular chaperone DnaK
VYSTERTLGEHGAKLADADRKAIEDALGEAREALKTDDLDRMKQAQDTLTRAAHKLAEVMYQASPPQGDQAGAGKPGAGAPGGAKDAEVVDAEFEDLGDKKS